MQTVYDQLTVRSQNRYNGIRRKVQFFTTFAGGVIEALRESGFRLCSFDKQPEFVAPFQSALDARAARAALASHSASFSAAGRAGNGNIELFFEQADRDQCKVLIVPYRRDLPFLSKGRFVAQLGFELSRYCNDPDTLRQAMAVNARSALGGFLGGSRLPKLYLDSPPDLKPPGTMTFELRGARLVVSMNVLANLGKYRLSDFELDIDGIREDLEVYFYGLEKYLALLLQSFGARMDIVDPESAAAEQAPPSTPNGVEAVPPPQPNPIYPPTPMPLAGAPLPPRPPADTVPLQPPPGF